MRSEKLLLLMTAAALLAAAPALGYEPDKYKSAQERFVQVLTGAGSFLGVGVQEITAERAKTLNLKEEYGVEVTRVEPDGPAEKGGVKVGDVVVEYNGQRVDGTEQFIRLVRETPVGRQVKLGIIRNGAPQTVEVATASRKSWAARRGEGFQYTWPDDWQFQMPQFRMPDIPRAHMSWRSAMIGIEAESLESQLADYFGVKSGVLVRSVSQGSPAEKAGLKAGDVILKVNNTSVSTPGDVSAAVRDAANRRSIPLQVMRERREMALTLVIEDAAPASPRAPRPATRIRQEFR
ncbi:MAG: PDZ domain-containing protein [Acidobacteria bacterium]|nr:PDZ domain-containing protein [Acidobacteriota bacterium]